MKLYRTSPELLEDRRLDPYYYDPVFVEHEQLLRRSFLQRDTVGEAFHVLDGTHDSVDTRERADDEFTITFLRSQDIGDCLIRPNAGAYLRKSDHVGKCKRSKIYYGDVLLNIMASTGQSCVYFPSYPSEANANRAVGILRSRDASLSEDEKVFLSVLLSSRAGGLELARNLKGSIQQRLNLSDISEVRFPRLGPQICRYISNKVRQAERFREIATECNRNITRGSTTPEIDEALKSKESKSNRTSSHRINPGRLDSKYYALKQEELLRVCALQSNCSIADLSPAVSNGFEEREFVEDGLSYITVSELATGRLDLSNCPKINASTNVPTKAKIDPRCVLVVRSGSIGTAVKVHQRHSHAVISSHLIRLRFEDEYQAIAVAAFLNSSAGNCLMWKISYGAVQSQIGQDELLSLPIPTVVIQNQNQLLEWWNQRESSIEIAQSLVSTAKLLVEALIERKITEAELIHAQTSLERGDETADRAILSRLFEGGWDATDTRPLFPDLDSYYETLRLMEREHSEVVAK